MDKTSLSINLKALKIMLKARIFDQKAMKLLKQGKSYFFIAGSGHEAPQIAYGMFYNPKSDFAFPYYRDVAFNLTVGVTPFDLFMSLLGKKNDYFSGARQLPTHYGAKHLNIVSQSSSTGMQYLQAVGMAHSIKFKGEKGVVYVSGGEGSTSEGEFFEAVNWATREKVPVVFMIENNNYAISVPFEKQGGAKNVGLLDHFAGYENLLRIPCDGSDFVESYRVIGAAYRHALETQDPVIIEAKVPRLSSHSSSDDQKKYRKIEELYEDQERDPIKILREYLITCEDVGEDEIQEIYEEIQAEIDEAAERALKEDDPEPQSAVNFVFDENQPEIVYDVKNYKENNVVMVDAINHALAEELEKNPLMVVYGEDVEDDKGGVFTATKGLSTKFGTHRVFNSPLAEASIVGTAIGMALNGMKPVVEIQFGDYIWTAYMQIRNELTTFRYRSNNHWPAPVVIRTPVGGYIHGGLCHSQNIEAFFTHMPGIYIVYPSNAEDAKGLLKTAINLNDPVLFLEHKGLYRNALATSKEPDENFYLPLGKAKIVSEGSDLTIITYGYMVYETKKAVKKFVENGYSIEIIDLRTMVPLDFETISDSIKKTNRVLIVHEDTLFSGFGGEISAQISEKLFQYLDAPILRIGAKDTPIPYAPNLENYILPNAKDIEEKIDYLLKF
jgi:2-oxoisovalerate dehydrogenase E1 component